MKRSSRMLWCGLLVGIGFALVSAARSALPQSPPPPNFETFFLFWSLAMMVAGAAITALVFDFGELVALVKNRRGTKTGDR
jgi:hypothetical protein